MPRVTLIGFTPDALETLLFTKQTRLQMSTRTLDEIKAWPMEKKLEQLEYMRNTIQSSWEFIDYIFCIEEVTRAFTHQLVRHRAGTSFAQQAQRAVDMSGFGYAVGPSIAAGETRLPVYQHVMSHINAGYQELLERGANPQDARGVLPTNIHTNIIFKANLRTLHDMGLKRLCVKAQGEFQDVFRMIRDEVVLVHPWAEKFIRVWCAFHGTCAFPTFPVKDCPVKPIVYDPETLDSYGAPEYMRGTLTQIQNVWANNRAEAQPVVPASDE